MASLASQFTALKCSRLSKKPIFPIRTKTTKTTLLPIVAASVISNAQTRERLKLKQVFQDAQERCRTSPMVNVPFNLDTFYSALDKYDFNSEIGAKVTGVVFHTDNRGALVDIGGVKSSARLNVEEACMHRIKHIKEVGIVAGVKEEFVIIDQSEDDDSLILSLKSIQVELAWERCRQLQGEDVVVKGKILGANKGGLVTVVEGLEGFIPFSQVSTTTDAEELIEKDIPLKFVEVDEEQSKIILSHRKAMASNRSQLGIGEVVIGTVETLKPFGAFIDIGGVSGLLHVSQISHDRVPDIAKVLQPGDILKVMILSHDRERNRLTLSTKKLEPTPGDMIRNPKLVFEKAEEMAQLFRQRISQVEAIARRGWISEGGLTLSADGTLGPASPELPSDGLDFSAAGL